MSKENLADDERNANLSDQAQRLHELELKYFNILETLKNIKEVWIGSDGFNIETNTEIYLERLCRDMYLQACNAITSDKK